MPSTVPPSWVTVIARPSANTTSDSVTTSAPTERDLVAATVAAIRPADAGATAAATSNTMTARTMRLLVRVDEGLVGVDARIGPPEEAHGVRGQVGAERRHADDDFLAVDGLERRAAGVAVA